MQLMFDDRRICNQNALLLDVYIYPRDVRMFAPYRLSAMMIVASVVLSAISLNRLSTERRLLSFLFGFLVVLQPFYRFDLEDDIRLKCGAYLYRSVV